MYTTHFISFSSLPHVLGYNICPPDMKGKIEDTTFIGIPKKEHSDYNMNRLEGHRNSLASVEAAGPTLREKNDVRC